MPHLSNNKLYHRGAGVTPVAQVTRRLERLKAACEAMGVSDSQLLPPDQKLTPEEEGEVEAARRAVRKTGKGGGQGEKGRGASSPE